ncbi:hypothetical protein PR048_005042 [Dryococelus australis]|uniref:Uncharacterized protein n=1 Tax=Dryococelus australis TaxID=614101 RepID=A0ABQ9I7J9_9NEOP|nr:hypothetical protein PR048_005042 [Dryococelus australis]
MEQWFQEDGATAHIAGEQVYRDPVPRDIEQLKTNIIRVIHAISRDRIGGMFANLQQRYERCVGLAGSYLEHIM